VKFWFSDDVRLRQDSTWLQADKWDLFPIRSLKEALFLRHRNRPPWLTISRCEARTQDWQIKSDWIFNQILTFRLFKKKFLKSMASYYHMSGIKGTLTCSWNLRPQLGPDREASKHCRNYLGPLIKASGFRITVIGLEIHAKVGAVGHNLIGGSETWLDSHFWPLTSHVPKASHGSSLLLCSKEDLANRPPAAVDHLLWFDSVCDACLADVSIQTL
jgi:hypothetical protein